MMKKNIYIFLILIIGLTSCKDNDVNVFDKTADERVAEAVSDLKQDLISPPNGWRIKYRPEESSGSFYVLAKFEEDNKVTLKTDLGASNGDYFEQTLTYRIDNSLGLELIFESYSFFSYLFEQDQATFGAEYEFDYVSKTPDDALVFKSKTDPSNATIILFEEANANDDELLGRVLSENLETFTSTKKITYLNKDLAIFLEMDAAKRIANFNYISLKSDISQGTALNLLTGYLIRGDSIVFDDALKVNFKGNNIEIKSLLLTTLGEIATNICPDPTTSPIYSGKTSANDAITLENSLFNNSGAEFITQSDLYYADIRNISDENNIRANEQISADISGSIAMLFYNNFPGNGGTINAIGFYIGNADGTTTIAVHKVTSTFTGNILELTVDPAVTVIRNSNTDADLTKMKPYIDLMTAGGKTYIYKVSDIFYELYNPCSGWRFVFQAL